VDARLALAASLAALPTVPLVEDLPRARVLSFAAERGSIEASTDAAGNALLRYGDPAARPLVLVAHLDHPGFTIDPGDPRHLDFHGGLAQDAVRPGAPVELFRRGELAPVGRAQVVEAEGAEGRLTGATVELVDGEAPGPGGFGMWGFPAWSVVDGLITGRVCDDLLGAAAILACLDELDRTRPPGVAVLGLFTRGEEIGFLGAIEAIRLGTVPLQADVISLECSKALPDAPQGGGVIVRVGDRMSLFEAGLTESLRVAATRAGATFQRKLMDGGACEATAFCAAGYRASGLAVPLGNYHNAADDGSGVAAETVRVDDWLAEVDLLVALASEPATPPATGLPAWYQERAGRARELLA
jgi:putative aminopeptidase FrvX